MPISRLAPPEYSRNKLAEALKTFGHIKDRHKSWMNFSLVTLGRGRVLHPHPVYSVQLSKFLSGKPLSSTLKKVEWMYFLRDRRSGLACGEVSIVSGRHKNPRLSEGPFVKKVFRLIEKSNRDPRIRRQQHELRSLRLESLHLFCLWLREHGGAEYFIPVTNCESLRAGEWISRKEFTKALRSEGQRIRVAQERMTSLLEEREALNLKLHD